MAFCGSGFLTLKWDPLFITRWEKGLWWPTSQQILFCFQNIQDALALKSPPHSETPKEQQCQHQITVSPGLCTQQEDSTSWLWSNTGKMVSLEKKRELPETITRISTTSNYRCLSPCSTSSSPPPGSCSLRTPSKPYCDIQTGSGRACHTLSLTCSNWGEQYPKLAPKLSHPDPWIMKGWDTTPWLCYFMGQKEFSRCN